MVHRIDDIGLGTWRNFCQRSGNGIGGAAVSKAGIGRQDQNAALFSHDSIYLT